MRFRAPAPRQSLIPQIPIRPFPGDRSTMTILTFNNIDKAYGDTVALRSVSFGVEEGQVFGLLGPNGAGKTTLIRILMDVIRPDGGSILLFGNEREDEQVDRIGYLPEERGLYVKHKVIDVMTYFGSLKGLSRAEARRRAHTWLERMELAETARWRVNRLSKGMSQKVQIAATLLAEPTLCILDEPFAGLDPVNVRLVREIIGERREAGLTTILSTHQMNLVETLCDSIAFLHRGELKEHGSVREVRQRYSLPEVRVRLQSSLPSVANITGSTQESDGMWRLTLAPGIEPQAILADLVAKGAVVDHFEKVLTPMDEVFVRVVQQTAS